MASQEGSRSNTPAGAASNGDDDASFPQYPGRATGPPSIISSRMTDIGTEDGRELEAQNPNRQSLATSQSGTVRSQISSQRAPGAWPQPTPLRRGLSGKRGSVAASIGSSSVATGGRPASAAGRSHVPSVSSHSFFRPMSSQKLQAQRGVARPSTMSRPPETAETLSQEVGPTTIGANVVRHSIQSQSTSRRYTGDEHPPPSRGTEVTAPETFDRATANTSANGHYPQGSVSDSVRPLNRQRETAENKGLAVNLDKSYKNSGQASPLTPRSFRSSFLLPGRSNQGENASNRNMQGGEKLESVASSPRFGDGATDPRPNTAVAPKAGRQEMGRNWEYFLGNTVFCMGGRLQNTKARPVNIATGAFVVLPCILFFVFSAHDLWHDVSPAVPLIFAYLSFICVSSFLHASTSDPGVSHFRILSKPDMRLTSEIDTTSQSSSKPTPRYQRGPFEAGTSQH